MMKGLYSVQTLYEDQVSADSLSYRLIIDSYMLILYPWKRFRFYFRNLFSKECEKSRRMRIEH